MASEASSGPSFLRIHAAWRLFVDNPRASRYRRTMRSLLFVLAIAAAVASCRSADSGARCPPLFTANENRARRLWDRLDDAPEGAAVIARASSLPLVCFGQVDLSMVTTEGIVLFDNTLDDDEGAARLGHLLAHIVDGMPMGKPSDADCETQVNDALRLEAKSMSLELRLQRDLRVRAKRQAYEFEAGYWAAEESNREKFLWDYLRAHPNGAPGLDALANGYAKRCREVH